MARFAQRTGWELSPNKIADILARLKKEGQVVIDLTESNPTRCGFAYPVAGIMSALQDPKNMEYSPSPQGTQDARLAICEYYLRRNIKVDPQNIFLTASTSEAYSFLFRLLAEPGDTVLFPCPSYPLFQFLVDLNDLKMGNYRLQYAQGCWQVDRKVLEQRITADTKAVVFVNPNNPTGSAVSDEEQVFSVDLCRRKDLPIISDEVFLDYPFAPGQMLSSFLQNTGSLVFVLGGLSKTMALPQMKLSWIVLGGPSADVQTARERLEVIADTYLSVNTPAQNALRPWLAIQPSIQQEVLARVRLNREQLKREFSSLLSADGGWYAVLRLPQGICEQDFVIRLLEEEKVFVHPGFFFDFEEEPFVVLSLLVPPELLDAGMLRIKKLLFSKQGKSEKS